MGDFLPFHVPFVGPEETEELLDTLRSGWLTLGPKTKRFEARLAQYVGSRHAIAVNSCTAGLHLALVALGIGEGDEVITTPLTFCATVNVIVHQRATPVLIDIRSDDFNLDPNQIEAKVTPRTKAIITVDFGGQPCRYAEINEIARRRGLRVIEDAAHSVGASYNGRKVGSLADITAFSFYATKNISTGEGGMVTTDDDELADRMRILSLHGISRDAWKRYSAEGSWYYEVLCPGYKYNMTDIQASLGLHQLERLDAWTEAKHRIADTYNQAFAVLPEVEVPQANSGVVHAWHLYVLRIREEALRINRAQFIEALRELGIGTSVHFIPIYRHPWYRQRYAFPPEAFPNTETFYRGAISLPIYPTMTDAQVERVIAAVQKTVRDNRR